VLLPSYNGARKLPNLTPLLALLLAREGVPVLVHGPSQTHGRVTSADIFAELGIPVCDNADGIVGALTRDRLAHAPLSLLAPGLNRLLETRARLGVRSSSHTLAKLIDPFAGNALRVVSVTHPDYLKRMREYLLAAGSPAMLMRGSEGEPVAGPRRALAMDCLHDGTDLALNSAEFSPDAELPESIDAGATARWIRRALSAEVPVPLPMIRQCAWIASASRRQWSALDTPAITTAE
jgi:anthranilate phosphoribosyltransferase